MKHDIMYGPTTQCISKSYYQMFQLSVIVPNLCHEPKSSLVNQLTVCWMLDQPSFRRRPQLINISHRILSDSLL